MNRMNRVKECSTFNCLKLDLFHGFDVQLKGTSKKGFLTEKVCSAFYQLS